jgi:hypothetical protein
MAWHIRGVGHIIAVPEGHEGTQLWVEDARLPLERAIQILYPGLTAIYLPKSITYRLLSPAARS